MISIIVPVYKVEPYLHQCVDSILQQTYWDIEILLIDDGSPDRCGEICEEYARSDQRIRVFHTQNKGLSAARNLGLREAKGEYIGFVDSDDWIEPDMYEILLRRMGVSAIIIEDKKGLKKNSLFGTEVEQTQATIEEFSEKIAAGKKAQLTDDFMIIARIESLILEKGVEEALTRAKAFVEAGADGIMIHSRRKEPDEILEFCDKFRANNKITPIVVVPSSFNTITEKELSEHGVNIVIYANQLTRSAFPAMQQTAEDILRYHRAKEVDDRLMPIKNIITLIEEI